MIKEYKFQISNTFARAENSPANSTLLANEIILQHPLGHKISFHFEYSEQELIFVSNVIEPVKKSTLLKQPHPEWYFHDHFVLFLDPQHDHMNQYLIAICKDGTEVKSYQISMPGEEITDKVHRNLKADDLQFTKEIQITEKGWQAKVRLPFQAIGLKSKSSVIGAKLKYGFEDAILYEAVTWPATIPEFNDTTIAFGDVFLNDGFVIEQMDLGTPYWKTGHISNTILLKGKTNASKNIQIKYATTNALGEIEKKELHADISNNGNFEIKIPWDCLFQNKWAPDITKVARTKLEFFDGTKNIWSATIPFGFDQGVIVRDPFGKFEDKIYERPKSNHPNFVDAFRCYLFSKLPNWVYQTTRDKAPSDFYLKDLSGKFDLNLMDENVLPQIAVFLKKQFENWQDALCAAALILHHPFLTRHTGSWNVISGRATTTTVLRLGGCFCGDTARVVAHLSEFISKEFNVPLKGYSLGLRGHLTGLVETPIGEVLLDPMIGLYYHTLDNTRLATLQEMQEDIRIQQRMWLLAYSNGHEFFINTYNQMKKPYQVGEFTYPGY